MSDSPSKTADAPRFKLPQATVERWEQIVTKAIRSGTDVAQLVQHFAEQSFQNKVALLETQGARRRALGNMLHVLERERTRAQNAAAEPPADKAGLQLKKPFVAVRVDFVPPEQAPKEQKRPMRAPPMSLTGERSGCKVTTLEPALQLVAALKRYLGTLDQQVEHTRKEMTQLDQVLNRGMRNHQAVVDELANTSRELYRLAQEVIARHGKGSQPLALVEDETKTYVKEAAAGAPSPSAHSS